MRKICQVIELLSFLVAHYKSIYKLSRFFSAALKFLARLPTPQITVSE